MKKASSDIIDVDGETVSVNKVDAALASVGVSLKNAKGEFRDLDDVFLELSSKWNSLDVMSQRYIATMAAGSRQQSRFIAMMQDYDRTIELVNAAYGSAGSSSKQFEKTQDSLESKFERLHNAWNTFLMGIADDSIIKTVIDLLAKLLEAYNKITEKADGLFGSIVRLGTAFAGLKMVGRIVDGIAAHFIGLKSSVDKTGTSVTILHKFSQKIDGFKMGRSFVIDADLNTNKVRGKLDDLKADMFTLQASIAASPQPTGAILGFQELKGQVVAASMTAEGATESVKIQLSEYGNAALLAARNTDEFGDEFTEAGIKGKAALDVLQKELEETIALQQAATQARGEKSFTYNGQEYENSKSFWSGLKGKRNDLEGDINNLSGAKKTVEKAEKTPGTWKYGFSTMLESIGPLIEPLLIIAAVLGTIAVVAAVIYNTSPLKKAKNEAENAAGAVEDYNRALEITKQKGEALNSILEELDNRKTTFDALITGSAEWYQAIAKTNEELIKQIDLLNSLGYDIEYSYDDNGMIQLDRNQVKTAQLQNAQQQVEITKGQSAAKHASEVANTKNEMIETNTKEQWSTFGKTFGKHMANAGILAGGTVAAGFGAGTAMSVTGVGVIPGLLTLLATPIVAAVELAGGLIIGAADGIKDAVDVIEEDKTNTSKDYAELTSEQKNILDAQAKEGASATWSLLVTDPDQKKAGLKVIQNMEDVYTQFYGEKFYQENFDGKFKVNNRGNSELEFADGSDINKSDLTVDFLSSLGYSGWSEAAAQLGLQWDSTIGGVEGLYKTDSDGNKVYLDVSSHGGVDTQEQWEELMSDPSGKNIDAGFLALKLFQGKSGSQLVSMLSNKIGDQAEQVLYGDANYQTSPVKETGLDDKIQNAINMAINEANANKRAIEESITDNYEAVNETKIKSDTVGLTDLVNEVYKISVDTNEQTAQAFQAAVLAAFASTNSQNLEEITKQYTTLFENLDMSKPTQALEVLDQKIEEGVEGAEELKEALMSSGAGLDMAHQFGELYSSGILDELGEDIVKLSDEAGAIDVTATRELVDSNSALKNIMDQFNVSGYAMGKILTDIQNGELTLTEVNNGLIESYKTLYSAMGQAEDVLYDLRNADLGEDYTEIGRTYEERYKTVQGLYERRAYGSENFTGNIKSLIGEEEWEKYLKEFEGSNKAAYEKIVKDYRLDKNIGNLYGSFSSLIKENETEVFGIDAEGKITYDLTVEGIDTYDDVLDHMVKAFGVSREYAKAMLADMATYSDTLQKDLNNLNSAANAQKNYESMYFEEGENKKIGYTAQTDAELAKIYGQTDEWTAAENAASAKDDWDSLSEQEKNDHIVAQFKNDQGIQNKVTDDSGHSYQITKVDSQGNKYYKDDSGKTKIKSKENNEREKTTTTVNDTITDRQGSDEKKYSYDIETEKWTASGKEAEQEQQVSLNADAIQSAMKTTTTATTLEEIAQEATISAEDALSGIQEIAKDPIIMQMATELNSEEYDAWLAANYGENAPEILLNAGFSQESLASVETAKNEMITQIQGIAQALADVEVTIPIVLAGGSVDFTIWGQTLSVGLDGFKTEVKVGGEGSNVKFTTNPSSSSSGTSQAPEIKKFNASSGGKGNGYPTGDDKDNSSGDSGGGDSETEEVEKRNYASENSDKQLEALERVRETNDREAELIDKLPEEIQYPLKMMNMAEDIASEYQEIQINKNKLAALEQERAIADAQAIEEGMLGAMGSDLPIYYDEALGSYMWNVEAMNNLSDEQREKAHETMDELSELNSSIEEVKQELDGGKIQKIFHTAGNASKSLSKAFKDTEGKTDDLGEAFEEIGKKYGLGDQFKALGQKIEGVIDSSEKLDKEFEGLGIVSEETLSKLDSLPIGEDTKNLIKNTFGTNQGGTVGSWTGDLLGAGGEMLTGIGDVLNFDMMSMGLDMFNQTKDMASQMIQYVVQFVQTIVSWWTNREDWLYNLLSAIEQEVRNFNRQGEVEERFRLYSDEGLEELVSAWKAMRVSLEKQIDLNEQLIQSRQAELQFLNLTNLPFSPAFYYDYEEERVIENPWVYDIYSLLLDIGAMIPGIGGIFSSIKQLMEDNKQRMESAVSEIEDARDEILELEKQQLELRTKYMDDEIELEELVMDAIIEKQQEEIDELTAMNDAIVEGNQKLIDALNEKLELIRQQRENEDREEELGQKERRLAFLRQDTSNANRKEILDLTDELKKERRDYTDELIDQKISALEKQNDEAAEQRQKQIDLMQEQLDYTERYGLQWAEAQTLIKNGFDSEGRLRVGTDLYNMLMSKEDFTSLGFGSTRQVKQLMDWDVTNIAAAAFRTINDVWEQGFGNFAMSNDVHEQGSLHLWADREIEYRQLPSWLSFLQPAYNSIQDYLWRTGNNIGAFAETAYGSDKNSTSILGKTLIPALENLFGSIKDKYNDYISVDASETGGVEVFPGIIGSTLDSRSRDWGERSIRTLGDGLESIGRSLTDGLTKVAETNTLRASASSQNIGDMTMNFYINSEDEENGTSIASSIIEAFREGVSNLSIFK